MMNPADVFEELRTALKPHGFELEHLGGGLVGLIFEGSDATIVVTEDGDAVLTGTYDGEAWNNGDVENAMSEYPLDGSLTVAQIVEQIVTIQETANIAEGEDVVVDPEASAAQWNAGVFMDRASNIEGPVSGDELTRQTALFPGTATMRGHVRAFFWFRASLHTSAVTR